MFLILVEKPVIYCVCSELIILAPVRECYFLSFSEGWKQKNEGKKKQKQLETILQIIFLEILTILPICHSTSPFFF